MNNNDSKSFLVWLLVIGSIILFIYLKRRYLKSFPQDSIIMINGDVGSGKSSTGLFVSYWWNKRKKKQVKRKNIFIRFINKIFHKSFKQKEKPLLYSNIPLFNVEYKEFTLAHLERKARFEYNSNICLNECSLIADSMLAYNMGKDEARRYVNDQLKLFCKLIRHELKGKGLCMVLDTQNPNDLALAGDRVLSSSYYIEGWINWIPFVRPVKLRKFVINMENVHNNYNESADETNTKWILVSKKVFNMYYTHSYEFLTRDKPIIGDVLFERVNWRNKKDMEKKFVIPTLNEYKEILESNERIEEMMKQERLRELEEIHKTAIKEDNENGKNEESKK